MESLLSIQGAMQSVGLIGRTVAISSESGQQSGTVSALNFVGGEPRLTVNLSNGSVLSDVSLAQLVSVK